MNFVAENHLITNGNTKLAVKIYPCAASETIILLHGGPGVPDEMTEVREFLSGHLQVITFDQRGIGMTDPQNCSFTMADYISDVNHIAAYFALDGFHLFGHSWGGLYAQLYAREFPERVLSLFLCSPASGTGRQWSLTEREVFRYNRERSTLGEWIWMGVNTALGLFGSSSAYRRLFRQIIINYHKGYNVEPPDPEKLARINAKAGTRTRNAIKKHPPLGVFGKTPYPVMITYGEFDAYGKSREFVLERFPFARTAIIPGSGHTPWKHNLKEFGKILNDFYVQGH
ncbi:MAG: alpha/beta hydrolase [Bacteroidales bacterium]|nr:alpha/beta hydrolase [Bacteroidales bacterium]